MTGVLVKGAQSWPRIVVEMVNNAAQLLIKNSVEQCLPFEEVLQFCYILILRVYKCRKLFDLRWQFSLRCW